MITQKLVSKKQYKNIKNKRENLEKCKIALFTLTVFEEIRILKIFRKYY